MRPTSPNLMEDVELGSSSINKSGTARTRPIKAKDSNIKLQPLVEPSSDNRRAAADGESSTLAKSIVATTMYSGCSIGMVLVNKSLASR